MAAIAISFRLGAKNMDYGHKTFAIADCQYAIGGASIEDLYKKGPMYK